MADFRAGDVYEVAELIVAHIDRVMNVFHFVLMKRGMRPVTCLVRTGPHRGRAG